MNKRETLTSGSETPRPGETPPPPAAEQVVDLERQSLSDRIEALSVPERMPETASYQCAWQLCTSAENLSEAVQMRYYRAQEYVLKILKALSLLVVEGSDAASQVRSFFADRSGIYIAHRASVADVRRVSDDMLSMPAALSAVRRAFSKVENDLAGTGVSDTRSELIADIKRYIAQIGEEGADDEPPRELIQLLHEKGRDINPKL